MRKLLFLIAVLVLGPSTTAYGGTPSEHDHQFAGRCVGSGLVTTVEKLTVVPTVTAIQFVSTGTCTGTVDGVAVSEVRYEGRTSSDAALLSCEVGAVEGTGTLAFPDLPGRPTIGVRFSDANVTGVSGFMLRGEDGGLAPGQHQLTPDLGLISECLTSGVDRIGNTISFGTLTPLRG